MPSVLFVFTSCDTNLIGKQTGYFLPEAAHPYYILSPTCSIEFASPKGSSIPVDEMSVKMYEADAECVKFLGDEEVKAKFAAAKMLGQVVVKDFDAVFYVGGFGPAIDLPFDKDNIKLASDFWKAGKLTAAVCHGPAALLNAVDAEGKSIFEGKNFTGFSDEEEVQYKSVEELIKKGGKFSMGDPWAPYTVVDGKLFTGQNPASALPLGKLVLENL